jgi:hypothetical protein
MSQAGVVAGGRLTGWISLGVLTSWVPADAVEGGNAQFKAFLRGPGKVLRPESPEMIEWENLDFGHIGQRVLLCAVYGDIHRQGHTMMVSARDRVADGQGLTRVPGQMAQLRQSGEAGQRRLKSQCHSAWVDLVVCLRFRAGCRPPLHSSIL